MIRTAPFKRTLAVSALLAVSCKGEVQSPDPSAVAPTLAVALATRSAEIHVVEGEFPAEPSDAMARATKGSRGWISVRTKREWARVEIDGERMGDTPISRTLVAAGHHTITLQFAGGSNVSRDFDVPSGGHLRLTAEPSGTAEDNL